MCTISRNKFKHHCLKNKIFFVDFLLHFRNVRAILNILKKKMSILAELFKKLLTSREVVT